MINSTSLKKSQILLSEEWALRETAAFGNRGNDKTSELIHRPLRSKLVSFANFEMFTDQGQNVKQELSNFKRYLYEDDEANSNQQPKENGYQRRKRAKVGDDKEIRLIKQRLESKMQQAQRKLQQMREGLKKHQMKKSEIIEKSDMRRSYMRSSLAG